MTTSLGGVVLNGTSGSVEMNITSEEYSKEAGLFIFTMPNSNDTDAWIDNFEGIKGTIKINGDGTGTEANLQTWEASLRALLSGSETSYTYSSDKFGSITVWIENIRVAWSSESDNYLTYSIDLVVGQS